MKVDPYQPCPCNSSKKAKFCCLKGKMWNKPPTILLAESLQHSHLKCFARKLHNCSSKISGEHFISHVLLNNLSTSDFVNIKGLHWQNEGVTVLKKNALISNILCTHHNTLLSPFDSEIGNLHKVINQYHTELQTPDPKDSFRIFCGEDLERWMLKTICGFVASKQVYWGKDRIDCVIPDIWIDILFKNVSFPPQWGMYLDSDNRETLKYSQQIELKFFLTGNSIRAGMFIINGLQFYLLVSDPHWTKGDLIHRPRGIEVSKDQIKKKIEISWQDKNYNRGLFISQI